MRWSAASNSVLVHLAGLATALIPTQPRFIDVWPWGGLEERLRTIEAPHISLAGGQAPRRGHTAVLGRLESAGDLRCPRQRPLDRIAAPDFPIFGDEGPFAQGGKTPQSPAFCLLIGADGRVSALTLAASSGDPGADRSLSRTIRRLPFRPALRGGRAVAAWHRLVVNHGTGQPFEPSPYVVVIEPTAPPPFDMSIATPRPPPPLKPPPEIAPAKSRVPATGSRRGVTGTRPLRDAPSPE